MKRAFISTILILLLGATPVFSVEAIQKPLSMNEIAVFSNEKGNLFGLKAKNSDEIIVDAKYKKLIRQLKASWIIKLKNKDYH